MSLDFNYSFCFRNSKKSVAFYSDNTVVFAAGKMCLLFDLDSKEQKNFEFCDRGEISALVRCGVLVVGAVRDHRPSVCVLNTLSEAKKLYSAPVSIQSEEFTCLSVSVNLKFVAAQGGSPDWLLVIWFSQTREVATILKPAGSSEAAIHDISFHAAGSVELIVVGKNVFKLYEYKDESEEGEAQFEEIVLKKFEEHGIYHAIAWPEKENLAVSSSEGKVLLFRGIELVHEISLEEDLKQTRCCDAAYSSKIVSSIVATPQQFLCVFSGFVVLIYEGEEMTSYALTKLVFLPQDSLNGNVPGELKEEPDCLINIFVSLDGRDFIGTTRDGQLLRCMDYAKGGERQEFTSLIQKQHNNPIIGMDIARNRPVIASSSQHTMILWNFQTKKQEIRKMFKDEICSVSMHPSGLYIALGFDLYCRVFSILYHDLRERELIPCRNCSLVGFSSGGQLLALVSGSVIEIYSFITSESLHKLDGHAGLVTSFDWIDCDTKLVSCDIRGVVCEWDLVFSKKNWEVTAVLSYSSVATNTTSENIIAVGSDKTVRCFEKAKLQWTLKCKKKVVCAVFCSDGQSFCVGTSDGCLELHTCPLSDESVLVHAHSGRVSVLKYDLKQSILISCGSDGSLFLWTNTKENKEVFERHMSKLCLVDSSNLQEQRDKMEQLRLSMQLTDTASDFEFNLKCIKHEEALRIMALDHEQKVDYLNKKIIQIEEEKQKLIFDFNLKNDQKELDTAVRKEIIDTTFKLHEAYKRSNAYANETNKIILDYENTINHLSEKHAKFSSTESKAIMKIADRIKAIENTLLLEKEISKQIRLTGNEYKEKAEREITEESGTVKGSQKTQVEKEESKSTEFHHEIEKLKQMIDFRVLDTTKLRNITAGQVDYDIREKVNSINLLNIAYQKFEGVLATKEKTCQNQEKKFCSMRKLVGSFEKYHTVSTTAIDELMIDIHSKQSKIESCQEAIKKLTESIPSLEEKIESIEDMYSTVTEKLFETLDGYQKKEKELRDTQDVMTKYITMLHRCITRECNPLKLVNDILHLFEESKTGPEGETLDPRLLGEYDFQIQELKSSYELIKNEPSKSMRNRAMAEFRLSQENSKILENIHVIQKDAEKLRLIINEMEIGLGLHTKSGRQFSDFRNQIEFVIETRKKDRKDKVEVISKLNSLIEEQQREIERFQTMLAAK